MNYLNSLIQDKNKLQNIINSYNSNLNIENNITFTEMINSISEMNNIPILGLSYLNLYGSTITNSYLLSNLNISSISDLTSTLARSALENLDGLQSWNVNHINSMYYSFQRMPNLKTALLPNWNTNNLTKLDSIFSYCPQLTDINFSNWNTEKMVNLAYTFSNLPSLVNLDVTNWDTKNVSFFGKLCMNCNSLSSFHTFSNWNVSNSNNFTWGFANCCQLRNLNDFSNWNFSKNNINIYGMFYQCQNLTDMTGIQNWNWDNIVDMRDIFYGCSNLTSIILNNCNLYNRTYVSVWGRCANLKDVTCDNWNLSSMTHMNLIEVFYNCPNIVNVSLTNIKFNNLQYLNNFCYDRPNYEGLNNICDVKYLNLANWDTSKVTNFTFAFAYIKPLEIDITGWSLANAVDITCMFYGCGDFNAGGSKTKGLTEMLSNKVFHNLVNTYSAFDGNEKDLNVYNLSMPNVTYATNMFHSLNTMTLINIDVPNITNMNIVRATEMKDLTIVNLNIPNVTTLNNTFKYANNLIRANLANWNTENITSMSMFFGDNSHVQDLDLSGWKINMSFGTFSIYSRSSLTNLNLSNWEIRRENIGSLGSPRLQRVDISNWHMNSTTNLLNISNLFGSSNNLTTIVNLNMLNMCITDMSRVLYNTQITDVDISNMNSTYLTSAISAFNNCQKLTHIKLFNGNNMNNLTSTTDMFSNARNLINIEGLETWKINNSNIRIDRMFMNCNNLSNDTLVNIAKMCLNMSSITRKNLSNYNSYSPFYTSNKQLNVTTIGQDLVNQLTAAGWTL